MRSSGASPTRADPPGVERELASAIRALRSLDPLIHEPSRLAILRVLHGEDAPGTTRSSLHASTGLGYQNLHNHLRKLEEAGFVRTRESFLAQKPSRVVSLTARGTDAFRAHLKNLMRAEAASRPPGNEAPKRPNPRPEGEQ